MSKYHSSIYQDVQLFHTFTDVVSDVRILAFVLSYHLTEASESRRKRVGDCLASISFLSRCGNVEVYFRSNVNNRSPSLSLSVCAS